MNPACATLGPCCPREGLSGQFGHPQGWQGVLVGHLMALKNEGINRFAVDALDVQPRDRVLEVGCGPGTALRQIAEKAAHGYAVGVDPSEVMRAQARRRVARLGDRCDVRPGSAEDLPFVEGSFDRVLTVNTLHHWDDVDRGLREMHRVLRYGGLALICARCAPKKPSRLVAPGFSDDAIQELTRRLAAAGFREVTVERREVGGREIALIRGRS